jgi:hypothetical protein
LRGGETRSPGQHLLEKGEKMSLEVSYLDRVGPRGKEEKKKKSERISSAAGLRIRMRTKRRAESQITCSRSAVSGDALTVSRVQPMNSNMGQATGLPSSGVVLHPTCSSREFTHVELAWVHGDCSATKQVDLSILLDPGGIERLEGQHRLMLQSASCM